ncbi:MAG: hypothetical protein ACMXYM_05175 [Candidatus Woesearchaeota archaeon]
MKTSHAIVLLTLLIIGCTPVEEMVLVQREPAVVPGGNLSYSFSSCIDDRCTHMFRYAADGMVSTLRLVESVNGTDTMLDDSALLSGVGMGYPPFNISIVGREEPVRHEEASIRYIRNEGGSLDRMVPGGRYNIEVGGPARTEGFRHGIVLDRGEQYPMLITAGQAEFSVELSSIVTALRGTGVFETDRLRIIYDGEETILESNESMTLPLYRDSIRIRLDPLEGSWIDEEKERFFQERRVSRIETTLGPFIMPLNIWVDTGVISLRYRGAEEPPYEIDYRYSAHGGGTFSVAETTSLRFMSGVYPLFNLSDAQRAPDQEVSITIGYFANESLERGDVITRLQGSHCLQLSNHGLTIDGERFFACANETYDLSAHGLPLTARFENETLVLTETNEMLRDGESAVVTTTKPAITVMLEPMIGTWERRR